MKQYAKLCFLVALVLLVTGIMAMAQSDNARVIGTVTDPSGAAIPGATITVTSLGTNRAVIAQSQADGNYAVNALPIGQYTVAVKKDSFKSESANVTLEISQVKEVNFKLQIGSTTETVNVTDDIPLVDTATSNAGEIIQGRQVVELPLNGRNFTSLALLTPGVARGAYSDQATGSNNQSETWRNSESGGGALAVNGLRPQANNFLIDGLDNNESLVNTLVIFPTVEDIAEFKVTTSVASAEFGRSGGAVVQVATKSGDNNIHGSGYWFARSREGAADPWRWGNSAAPVLKRNQFGASLGAPIWKNKVFGFVDYQGWRQKTPQVDGMDTVPTAAMRNGDFSELLSPAGVGTATSLPFATLPGCIAAKASNPTAFNAGMGYVFNPQTCLPFGWDAVTHTAGTQINIIPLANRNTVGMKYLNAFPLPNVTGYNSAIFDKANNFQPRRKINKILDDYDARLDFVATHKDTIFARYSIGQDLLQDTDKLVDASHDLPSGYGSGSNPQHPRQLAVGYTRVINDKIINEFHYGYSRPFFAYQQPGYGATQAANLGIPNANTSPLLGGMPAIDSGQRLEYVGDGGPYTVIEGSHQFVDSLTWVHGRHNIKLGLSLIHRNVDITQGNNAKGNFCMSAADGWCWPDQGPIGGFTGHAISEAAAGFAWDYTIGVFNGYYRTRNWENGFFAQDDFRVSRKLTLNLGLRYDILTWPTEQHGRQSNFDPSTGTLVLPGTKGWTNSLIDTPKGNVGPRVGFAYDMTGDGKNVIRGGYGLFYYPDRGGVDDQLSNNPNFNGSQTYYACPSADPTCASGARITLSGAAPNGSLDPTVATGPLPVAQVTVDPKHLTSSQNVIYYPKNNKNSNIQQWNIQLERALNSSTSLDLAYVGTHMGHLSTSFNANNPTLIGTTVWFPNVGSIKENATIGNGNYNGFQARLNHKMSHGLLYTVAYTWSHTLDNAPSAITGGTTTNMAPNGKPLLQYNYGNSNSDQRQLLVASALYELPFGRGKMFLNSMPRVADLFLGGWQLNNVLTLTTGTPIDFVGQSSDSNLSRPTNVRPDYHGGCKEDYSSTIWLHCSAGAFTTPASGVVGTLARNYFHGPGYHVWDMSLAKNFKVTERVKTEFRAQVYNMANTPQKQNPGSTNSWSDSKVNDYSTTAPRTDSQRELELVLRVSF